MRYSYCVIVALILSGQALFSRQPRSPAIPTSVVPVDQGRLEPSFASFRSGLAKAAARGDLSAVLRTVSPDIEASIEVSIVGRRGLAALKKEWDLDKSPTDFLNELTEVLSLGGRFDTGRQTFTAPYTYTEFPGQADEMPDYVFVIRKSAPAFERPDKRSRIVTTLSYNVLKYYTAGVGWLNVQLPGGAWAYIRDEDGRSPVETMAVFEKGRTGWLMTTFVGGVD